MNEDDASYTRSAVADRVAFDYDYCQAVKGAFDLDNSDYLTDEDNDSGYLTDEDNDNDSNDASPVDPQPIDHRGTKRTFPGSDGESLRSEASDSDTPGAPLPPQGNKPSKQAKRRKRDKARRKCQRQQDKAANTLEATRRLFSNAEAVGADYSPQQYPVNSSGYEAVRGRKHRVVETPSELRAKGYDEEHWDGRTPKVLYARGGKEVMAWLVGQPGGTYSTAAEGALDDILDARPHLKLNDKDCDHRRHNSPAAHWGFSHGNGSTEPHNLAIPKKNRKVVEPVTASRHLHRLARFGNHAYGAVFPLIHGEMKEYLTSLRSEERFSHLQYPFPGSEFPAATINFGPRVACFEHRDHLNVPHGMCAVTSLGRFDPTQGGHLVLHDLKVFIQFPPGALILLPSATLRHANTPIQDGETRVSFTQYCAGSLYRFVDNGFRTDTDFLEKDPQGYREAMKRREDRWRDAMSKIPTIDSLLSPAHT